MLRRLLYYERRRIAIFAPMAGLALALAASWSPVMTFSPLGIAGMFALGFGAIAAVFLMFAAVEEGVEARARNLLGSASVGLLGTSLTLQVWPSLAGAVEPPLLRCVILALGFMLAFHAVFHGGYLDRLLPKKAVTRRATIRTSLGRDALWAGLVGTPPDTPPLAFPNVVEFAFLDPGREDRKLVTRLPNGALMEEHARVTVFEKGARIAYECVHPHVPETNPFREIRFDLRFEEAGSHRLFRIEEGFQPLPFSLRTTLWLDDQPGRRAARHIARLEAMAPRRTV